MIHLTHHAIERAMDRIAGIATPEDARQALTSPAVVLAVQIGAPFVRLGTGQRIVIENGSVITVLPSETLRGRLGADRANATGTRRVRGVKALGGAENGRNGL